MNMCNYRLLDETKGGIGNVMDTLHSRRIDLCQRIQG